MYWRISGAWRRLVWRLTLPDDLFNRAFMEWCERLQRQRWVEDHAEEIAALHARLDEKRRREERRMREEWLEANKGWAMPVRTPP